MREAMQPPRDTILLVDDNLTNLKVLLDLLQAQGLAIAVARSGAEALERLLHLTPDLILLDVLMPGLNGFDTCRRIKAQSAYRDIPLLFMTALTDVDSKLQGFAVGGVDYLTKPFETSEVLARVHTHLTIRRLHQRLALQNAELQATNMQLQELTTTLRTTMEEVKTLRGLIPICAWCKQVRDVQGLWHELEAYVREHTEADFTHGLCPACRKDAFS
jgi:DNA-binding response OmpR family regulator